MLGNQGLDLGLACLRVCDCCSALGSVVVALCNLVVRSACYPGAGRGSWRLAGTTTGRSPTLQPGP